MKSMNTSNPPCAERRPVTSEHHGISRTDDYAWLKADNWQEVMQKPDRLPADIRAYLEAENAYTDAMMVDTEALQQELFKEMKGRIKEDDSSVPLPDGAYAYGIKYVTGGQHPQIIRTTRDGRHEKVLIDGNAEASGKAYFRLGGTAHSPDHRLIAWSFDDKGSEYFTLRLRDTQSGEDSATAIPNTAGGAVWSADATHVFYVLMDDNHRPSKLYRHEVGSDPADDVLVHEESDPGFFMGVGKTQSDRFIVVSCHDHETSENWLIPADDPTAAPRLVAPRDPGVEYSLDEAGGIFYILTNADGAEDFKIVTASADAPGRKNWRDLVPQQQDALILAHSTLKNHLIRLERVAGLPRIVIRRLSDGEEHEIAFDEEAYSLGLMGGYEFDTTQIRFSYSSMTTPSRVYDYDAQTRERTLRKEQEVPSGHDPADYVTRRIMAPAADGETVPVSLLYHKDTPLNGAAPCWLYGYGAYGMAIPASFSTNRLSLVDRGFVYAIAHVRGGKEKGYRWYTAGKRDKKPNTFADFLAVARHLAAEGFTSQGNIVAHGGSAGGMLMGAVANTGPQMFRAIVADVPFVDVLTTMLDATLPLTPPEWPEWGNPGASQKDYRTIAAYSPYDNVTAQNYPHILAIAGLTDPRVTYWEPAKWVAKLRAHKTDENLLLLKTHMDSGHAGAAGRFDSLKEVALTYAFGLKVCGLANAMA
jgi:oligopeptidase B